MHFGTIAIRRAGHTFREGSVVFHDLAGLRALAEYHSGYLDQSNGLGL
jgi:hypothetical protein